MKKQKWYTRLGSLICLAVSTTVMAEDFGLNWQIGDRWSVETQTLQSPSSFRKVHAGAVEWNFQVTGEDKVSGELCFRVDITCADQRRLQPNVTIWVQQRTGMLVRLTSRVPVDGKYMEYTESYAMADGVPTPVLGIIPALPLDLPIFSPTMRNSTSLEPMVYESVAGNGQTKDLNEMRFAYAVTQTVTDVPGNRMKSLSDNGVDEGGVKVHMQVGNQNVEQYWTPNKPWPVYSTNGAAVSRLKAYVPANKEEK